jgi:fused signal recognition particle receptor
MVFNWFRRKFDDDKDNLASVDKSTQEGEKTEESIAKTGEPEPFTTPAPPQDLLDWAKTAYANIQAREYHC